MASRQASETSFFSLSDVRERMREKKNSALRTAKLNASLASKIRTKIINNSSTIKISLKHNNKALALALNAEKASAQRLTQEKMILQKEVEQCHFETAVLRHRLSFLSNTLKEIENLAAGAKMACLSEFHRSSASLSNGQKSSMTEDSWANDIADGQLVRAAGMPLRVPISKLCDAGQQDGSSTAVQTSSLDFQRSASNEPLEIVPFASKDTLPSAEQPQSHQEENGKKQTEALEAQEAFLGSGIFGEALCTTQQEPNNMPVLVQEGHPSSFEGDEMAKHFLDRLSQGHVTERRKQSSLFVTSTPSSVVDIVPHVSSTQAARWSIPKDSSSSSKSNTQPQLKPPSSLVSPTQTTVIPVRKSLAKEIFCYQPQAKETECAVEMDLRDSRVPEFVPIKVKSKGNCKTVEKKTVEKKTVEKKTVEKKTVEKKTVKKASTGKKTTNAITNKAESSLDLLQDEDSAQNAEKLLQPKAATCSSESEVSEMRQTASVGAFNKKNRGCGVKKDYCSADEVQDLKRTNMVNPAQPQLQSLQSGDLLQQVTKEAIFEIQSVESVSKSPAGTFLSHELPSDDSSVQNTVFVRKETSSACALQKDLSRNSESIRQKIKRRTREIRQRDESDEDLLNGVKIPGAKAEEQPKKSQSESPAGTFSSHEVPLDDCSFLKKIEFCKETLSACALQRDSSGSTKSIRQKKTRTTTVIRQRDESDEENLPNIVKIPGSKDEEQPKRSLTSRNKTVRKSSCSDQRNEVLGPCIDVQGVAKESTKESPCNLKRSRKIYVVRNLDCAGNLDCVQTDSERGEIVPHMSIPGRKASKIPRFQSREAVQSNKKQTGGIKEKQQARADNMNALKKDFYPKLKPQQKRNTSSPPEAHSLARQSDGTKALVELPSRQTVLMGKFSCIADLLSEPDAFLKEQIAEISLENHLMDVSRSLESSSVTCSAALPVSSRLTVPKSLSTEGNRMTEKSFVWLERSLVFKEMPAEEIPGERNQFESSSWSLHSEEPAMRLQDLTSTRTLPSFSSEQELRRSSRRKENTPCYAEPKMNRKLRRGDPFTDMEFLHNPLHRKKNNKKKTVKAKGMTNKVKEEKQLLLEGCPSAKSSELITMGRDT